MVTNRHMIICKPTKLSIVIVTRDFDPHLYIRFGSYLEDYRVKYSDNTAGLAPILDVLHKLDNTLMNV